MTCPYAGSIPTLRLNAVSVNPFVPGSSPGRGASIHAGFRDLSRLHIFSGVTLGLHMPPLPRSQSAMFGRSACHWQIDNQAATGTWIRPW